MIIHAWDGQSSCRTAHNPSVLDYMQVTVDNVLSLIQPQMEACNTDYLLKTYIQLIINNTSIVDLERTWAWVSQCLNYEITSHMGLQQTCT